MTGTILGTRFNKQGARKEVCISSSTMQRYESRATRKENVFNICKGTRIRKRVNNSFSREEMGTCGNCIREVRFPNTRIHIVCKSRVNF